MITIHSPSRYRINKKQIKELVEKIIKQMDLDPTNSLNVVFVGKVSMKKYALTYKHENEALPVLSFPYKEHIEGEKLLGEIILCYPQAVIFAAQRSKKVIDILEWLIKHAITNLVQA